MAGYRVFRGGSQLGADLPATARSFSDAGLAPGTYSYTVRAFDAAGNVSVDSNVVTVTVPVPDTTAPTTPALSGSRVGTTANLSWTAATDAVGVAGYRVFRGGSQLGADLPATARSFSDAGLAPGTYSYTVRAFDAAGNVSVDSNVVTVTVPVPDTTAPTAPTLSGSVTGTTANLSWTAATDAVGVTGYRIFRGASQVGTTAATTRTFSQANLPAGTYAYTVRAVDAAGNVSAASNAVSLTVAAANPAPTVTTRSPAAGSTAVAVSSNITATFSEPVVGVGAATFQVRNPAGTVVAGAITQSTTVANQWILNPTANLSADTRYTVTLTGGAGAIRDTAGAPLATSSWTFTTGPAPRVTARTPGVGAVRVSRTANVTATFSEAVQPASVSGTTFTLRNPAGSQISAVVTYNTTSRVATLNPSVTLAPNTTYRVNLVGGTTGVRDLAGNPLANVTWTFTTGP